MIFSPYLIGFYLIIIFIIFSLLTKNEGFQNYSDVSAWQRVLQPLNFWLAQFYPNYSNHDYYYPSGPWNQSTQFHY